jgi:hypothetical protein
MKAARQPKAQRVTHPAAGRGQRALEISAAFGVWARLAVLAAGLWLAIDAGPGKAGSSPAWWAGPRWSCWHVPAAS